MHTLSGGLLAWLSVCLSGPYADLHMGQRIPLPLTVSCFSKIQIGFIILVPAHPGSPGQSAVKWVCVCVCLSGSLSQTLDLGNFITVRKSSQCVDIFVPAVVSWSRFITKLPTFDPRPRPVCHSEHLPLCVAWCRRGSLSHGSICNSWYLLSFLGNNYVKINL